MPVSSISAAMYSRAPSTVPAKPPRIACQSAKSSGSTPSSGEGTSYLRHSRLMLRNRGRQECHDVDLVLGRPGRALRPRDPEPQGWMGLLQRAEVHRHGVEVVAL